MLAGWATTLGPAPRGSESKLYQRLIVNPGKPDKSENGNYRPFTLRGQSNKDGKISRIQRADSFPLVPCSLAAIGPPPVGALRSATTARPRASPFASHPSARRTVSWDSLPALPRRGWAPRDALADTPRLSLFTRNERAVAGSSPGNARYSFLFIFIFVLVENKYAPRHLAGVAAATAAARAMPAALTPRPSPRPSHGRCIEQRRAGLQPGLQPGLQQCRQNT